MSELSGGASFGLLTAITLLGAPTVHSAAVSSWMPTSTVGAPAARCEPKSVATGSGMIVWGSYEFSAFNTGGVYDAAADNWKPTSTVLAPMARQYHTLVWTGSRMLVWGGFDGYSYYMN